MTTCQSISYWFNSISSKNILSFYLSSPMHRNVSFDDVLYLFWVVWEINLNNCVRRINSFLIIIFLFVVARIWTQTLHILCIVHTNWLAKLARIIYIYIYMSSTPSFNYFFGKSLSVYERSFISTLFAPFPFVLLFLPN